MTYQEIMKQAETLNIKELDLDFGQAERITLKYRNHRFEETNLAYTNQLTITTFINQNKLSQTISQINPKKIAETLKNMKMLSEFKTKEIDQKPLNPKGLIYMPINKQTFTTPSIVSIKDIIKKLELKINNLDDCIIKDNTTIYYDVNRVENQKYNSNNLSLESAHGRVFVFFVMVYIDTGEIKESIYITRYYQHLDDIDQADILAEIQSKINLKKEVAKIETGSYQIIFDENMLGKLLKPFLKHFKAQAVIDQESVWKDKYQQIVMAPTITLIDKPQCSALGLEITHDDEGFPARIQTFVDQGVLKKWVHNQKTAQLLDQHNTGNASGDDVSFHNLILKPGFKKKNAILKRIKKGIFIDDLKGLHSGTNAANGDFSLEFSGNIIINGKIGGVIKNGSVTGNLFKDVLPHITEVAHELPLHKGCKFPLVKVAKSLSIAV